MVVKIYPSFLPISISFDFVSEFFSGNSCFRSQDQDEAFVEHNYKNRLEEPI